MRTRTDRYADIRLPSSYLDASGVASAPVVAHGIKHMILDETDQERRHGQSGVSIHEMVNAMIGCPALVGLGVYLIITSLQKTASSTPPTWTEINLGFDVSIVVAVCAGLACIAGGIYLVRCGGRLHRLFLSENAGKVPPDMRP